MAVRFFALFLACACSVAALQGRAEEDVKPGLIGEYFDMESALEDFPKLPADKKPSIKRVDKQVNGEETTENFFNTDLSQHFYVKWSGSLKVLAAGQYVLCVESDDGSRLFIDAKPVVDHPGLHAMDKKCAEVELSAGQHELKLEYFQNEGGCGCKLWWKKPGGKDELVPEENLWHKAEAEK